MTEITTLVDTLIGPIVAALLTIMVLSYLIGDNPLFRLATHLFIGVAAGYAGAVGGPLGVVARTAAAHPASRPGRTAQSDGGADAARPGAAGVLAGPQTRPGAFAAGTFSTAFLVGVGAAVVVGGAITGTLIPQSLAAMGTFDPGVVSPQTGETGFERVVNVVILLTGTLSTLAYFRFTLRRGPGVRAARWGRSACWGRPSLRSAGRSSRWPSG